MVEASIAKTGLSIESSRSFSPAYNCLASLIRIHAKSANILQSHFSFAVDNVLLAIASPMPRWYNLLELAFKQRIVSDKLSR